MFYVYILYMWPTVWIRSIIIILNSIYHYQFGMKACYIYLFVCLRKTTFSDTFWLIQCFFSDMQNVISLSCCQHPLVGLLESTWKRIFKRKPTIREFKIECNRILRFVLLTSFRDPPCPLQVHFQVFWLVSWGHNSVSLDGHCYDSLLKCSDTESSEEDNGSSI